MIQKDNRIILLSIKNQCKYEVCFVDFLFDKK